MPASTLLKLATQAAARNASQIYDLADMPYQLARPILLEIKSPQHLRDLEANCPHVAENSEELWKAFIARDIPDYESKMVAPKNPTSWHKVYRYLQREEEKKAEADEEALRRTLQGETLKKAQSKALFVKKALPHPRAEDEHNKFIDGVKRTNLNDWGIQKKPPALKNAKTGADMIAAIRRQTAQVSREKAMGRLPMQGSSQSQRLANAKHQIQQAPQSMVREAQAGRPLVIAPREPLPHEKVILAERKREQARNKKIITPNTRLSNLEYVKRNQQTVDTARRQAQAENEAQLKALSQQQKKSAGSSSVTAKVFTTSPAIHKPAIKSQSPPAHGPAAIPSPHKSATKATVRPSSPESASLSIEAPNQLSLPAAEEVADKKRALTSTSPEASPPPKVARKRPAPSIFMANKKRKL